MNNVTNFISGIRWQDIIDITLMSYIIFRLYILFRGTNVIRVLIGIAFLWFSQRIASWLGLIVTSWALQGVTAVAAIILIVIFRNEIRSVLQMKNLRMFLWGFLLKSVETPGDAIVEGVFRLAGNGHGALLVLPGKEDILEKVHSGIAWDGKVSEEMINSIFWPDNPVHDGAAVINGDRITQVGAILPLSRRTDLPSYYGTRHRAAAGLAEQSDAMVIVVSEERSSIVASKDSTIFPINRKKDLSDLIKEHLGISSDTGRILKKQRRELALAAMVSFIFVSLIWLSFTRGIDTLISLEIPVEYTNRQPGLDIYDTSANTVLLDISGSGARLKSIKTENVRVTVDLNNTHIGKNNCLISEKNISLPPGVSLKNIRPPYIEVTIDRSVDKKIPVQVDWTGKLPDNLTISDVIIEPPEVRISGRSMIMDDISTVYTENVSLSDIEESGELNVSIILSDPSLRLIDNQGSVKVRYFIE